MCKKTVFAFGVYLLSFVANAQTDEIDKVLHEVEQNNKELKAYADLMDSRRLELKSTNNLPDPQTGFFYLPWGEHTSGDYTEFQFTQSFEFPTVYGVRSELIEKQLESMRLDYRAMKQRVLLPAKRHCVELIYRNRRLAVEQSRVQQAKQVFDQVEELFEKEHGHDDGTGEYGHSHEEGTEGHDHDEDEHHEQEEFSVDGDSTHVKNDSSHHSHENGDDHHH